MGSPDQSLNLKDNSFNILLSHHGIKRDRKTFLVILFCYRTIPPLGPKIFPIKRLGVNRDIMNLRLNSIFLQFNHNLCPGHSNFLKIKLKDIKVKIVVAKFFFVRNLEMLNIFERMIVLTDNFSSSSTEFIQLSKLRNAQSALNVCDPIIISQIILLVIPGFCDGITPRLLVFFKGVFLIRK